MKKNILEQMLHVANQKGVEKFLEDFDILRNVPAEGRVAVIKNVTILFELFQDPDEQDFLESALPASVDLGIFLPLIIRIVKEGCYDIITNPKDFISFCGAWISLNLESIYNSGFDPEAMIVAHLTERIVKIIRQ